MLAYIFFAMLMCSILSISIISEKKTKLTRKNYYLYHQFRLYYHVYIAYNLIISVFKRGSKFAEWGPNPLVDMDPQGSGYEVDAVNYIYIYMER